MSKKKTTNYCIFLRIDSLSLTENTGSGIFETLNLRIFWGSMPPDPLDWAAFGATTFLYRVRTPQSKSCATPLIGCNKGGNLCEKGKAACGIGLLLLELLEIQLEKMF